jgi:hypothetical protein
MFAAGIEDQKKKGILIDHFSWWRVESFRFVVAQ